MSLRRSAWLLAPVHAAALLSAAKSFRNNPIMGSVALNEAGLHVLRVRLAAAMAATRRRRLAYLLNEKDVRDFHRDGFVLRENYLPASSFRALQDEVAALAAPAREMIQGDAVTRRIALDIHTLTRLPAARALVEDPYWLALIRYAASSALSPLTYVQTIFSRVRTGAIDPQTSLHADTFHSTVKAWFFLTDVAADAGPFVYVPGSHRLTPERLEWERHMSLVARGSDNNETQEGSFRIRPSALEALGLPQPRRFAVSANTLIVADTMGFHARGTSEQPSVRIEIWAYGRRNPFLPWLGGDPVAMPLIKGRAVPFFWAASDLGERLGLGRNPWRPAGVLTPGAPASLHLFN